MKKQTKIVATISDIKCEIDFIRQLFEAGMDVVRMNTAHASFDGARNLINNVRQVSEKIALLIDTKGPEIRTTSTNGTDIQLKKGEKVYIMGNKKGISSHDCIFVSFDNFVNEIPIDSEILIADGEICLKVKSKDGDKLLCEVMNDAELGSRKNLNVPGVEINLPSLSDKDCEFIDFAIENDVDFIAHSFVRNKEDILAVQKKLDEKNSKIKIIAKIENQQGVDNIDEILDHAYGVMVARGDLGIEIPPEKIPVIQKMLEHKCISRRKPVIVATQMLHTMIENPRPTRAEVNDVANAIFDGADAVMLSGETANGLYPVEAVKTMAKIALEVEGTKHEFSDIIQISNLNAVTEYLAKSAVKASSRLNANAIIADSTSGRTIRNLSAYRGKKPIYAMCYNKRLVRELALSYGVYPDYLEPRKSTDEFLRTAIMMLIKKQYLDKDDLVVVVAGNFGPSSGASFVEIGHAKHLLLRE